MMAPKFLKCRVEKKYHGPFALACPLIIGWDHETPRRCFVRLLTDKKREYTGSSSSEKRSFTFSILFHGRKSTLSREITAR